MEPHVSPHLQPLSYMYQLASGHSNPPGIRGLESEPADRREQRARASRSLTVSPEIGKGTKDDQQRTTNNSDLR